MQMKPPTFVHDQFFSLLFLVLGVGFLIGDQDSIVSSGLNTLLPLLGSETGSLPSKSALALNVSNIKTKSITSKI